jgi:hypothetical protein
MLYYTFRYKILAGSSMCGLELEHHPWGTW